MLVGDRAKYLGIDRKSTRLNSSHGYISYAVFCLKKKKENEHDLMIGREPLRSQILNSLISTRKAKLNTTAFSIRQLQHSLVHVPSRLCTRTNSSYAGHIHNRC